MRLGFGFPSTSGSQGTRAVRRRSLLLAVVGIAILPLAWRGPSCGQDFDFHLQNWLEVVDHWHHGILLPHWAASANYLAGEPRFLFYPPLSWILGGLLGLLLPWSWTPLAFSVIALLGAGFSMRAMAREWLSDESATLAACLYVVNPYMLFVVYDRGALAELLAATWIPLLVLFALREKPSLQKANIVPLALTFAALWLTDAPAAVMGSYALLLLVAVAAIQQRSWHLIARSAAAVPLGLALAGFWLIPAIVEQRWVQIQRAVGPLMRVEDSFLFGFVPLPTGPADQRFDTIYHNEILRTVSWIAVVLIAVILLAAVLLRSRRTLLWTPLLFLAFAIIVLQFRFSELFWRVIPELHFLQFPWRWLLVLGMVAALFAAAVSPPATTRRAHGFRAVLVLLLACGLSAWAALSFWQPCDGEDNIAAQRAAFRSTGFEGTDEYTLRGVDETTLAGFPPDGSAPTGAVLEVIAANTGTPGLNQAEIPATTKILRWTPERYSVRVSTQRAGFAVLRLTAYPSWRVLLNGAELPNPEHRANGLLLIPVAAGQNDIEIRWRITRDQQLGIVLSVIALAVTLALAFAARRNAQKVPLP